MRYLWTPRNFILPATPAQWPVPSVKRTSPARAELRPRQKQALEFPIAARRRWRSLQSRRTGLINCDSTSRNRNSVPRPLPPRPVPTGEQVRAEADVLRTRRRAATGPSSARNHHGQPKHRARHPRIFSIAGRTADDDLQRTRPRSFFPGSTRGGENFRGADSQQAVHRRRRGALRAGPAVSARPTPLPSSASRGPISSSARGRPRSSATWAPAR